MRILKRSIVGVVGVILVCTPLRAQIVAEQPAEFSGLQGQRGWTYGYYERSVDTDSGGNGIYNDTKFTEFLGGSDSGLSFASGKNHWTLTNWSLSAGPAFTEITSEEMWPNTLRGLEHFAIIRWVSDEAGVASLNGFFNKKEPGRGDGTIGRIFRNGTEIFSKLSFDAPADFDLTIPDMVEGDIFDFAVDFGSEFSGNDNSDGTAYSFIFDMTVFGDFDQSRELDQPDIDALTAQVASGDNDLAYDLNADDAVNLADINVWIKDLRNSWIGDVDVNGQFDSADIVTLLGAGTFDQDVDSVWSTGDFNGDKRTNSADLIAALSDGGFGSGVRTAVSAVPEPASMLLMLLGGVTLLRVTRRGR